jgi:hypothetical protein
MAELDETLRLHLQLERKPPREQAASREAFGSRSRGRGPTRRGHLLHDLASQDMPTKETYKVHHWNARNSLDDVDGELNGFAAEGWRLMGPPTAITYQGAETLVFLLERDERTPGRGVIV